jgi:hypothetical protein
MASVPYNNNSYSFITNSEIYEVENTFKKYNLLLVNGDRIKMSRIIEISLERSKERKSVAEKNDPSDWTCAMASRNILVLKNKKKKKLHGLSPQANYTDRATYACRRATWSA